MAKKNQEQVSLFDDEQLLELALENIQFLKKRLVDNPSLNLSEEEKDYVLNLGKATTLTEEPIQVEKLEDKKVSPFAKMVLTVSQTFSNATKALRNYREFVDSSRNEQSNIINAVEYINPEIEISSQVKSKGFAKNIDDIKNNFTDGVSAKVSRGVRSVESKAEDVKVNFMDFYDEVSLSTMKVRDNVKSNVLSAKTKFETFAKVFEEPIIQVKFKGVDGLTIDKVSYNTGLFLGKSKTLIETKLKDLSEVIMSAKENKIKPVPSNNSTIIGTRLEPSMSVSEPNPKNVKDSVLSQKIDGALDAQQVISDKLNSPKETPPGDSVKPPIENKTWYSKLRDFFKSEAVVEVKKAQSNEVEPEVVVGSMIKPEDTSLFKRKPDGSYPEAVETFRQTTANLERDLGLRVNESGNYTFDKLNYDKSGNLMSPVQKMIVLNDVIKPNILKHTQEASDILFSLNETSKKDPIMKSFKALSQKLGGDAAALGMIEAAMYSKDSAFELKRMGGPAVMNLLNDPSASLDKIKNDMYVLDVATLNLKNVINFGNIVKDEAHFTATQNGLVNNVSKSINSYVLREFDNGKKVRLLDLVQSFSKMDFSKSQAVAGNEDIVFRVLDKRADYANSLELKVQQNLDKMAEENLIKNRENIANMIKSDSDHSMGKTVTESPPSNLSDAAGYDAVSVRMKKDQAIDKSLAWKNDQDRFFHGSSAARPYMGVGKPPVQNPNIYVAQDNMGMNHKAEITPVVIKGEIGKAPKPLEPVSLELNSGAIDEARSVATEAPDQEPVTGKPISRFRR